MNIAFFLKPKEEVEFVYDDFTLRQGLEKMKHHSYTAIPVIGRDGKYITTISEGDFLWFILKDVDEELREMPMQSLEDACIRDVMERGKNPPVPITSTTSDLITRAMEQNFIPVVDDAGSFIGIVTRRSLLRCFAKQIK
ncbi:MAG: CBS domain-containing protein [Clostridiales bacterium]|nr:CBS domain-containing protein [Clostridiales bacterium]